MSHLWHHWAGLWTCARLPRAMSCPHVGYASGLAADGYRALVLVWPGLWVIGVVLAVRLRWTHPPWGPVPGAACGQLILNYGYYGSYSGPWVAGARGSAVFTRLRRGAQLRS